MKNQSAQLSCQSMHLPNASTRVPKVVALLYRVRGYLRRHGFLATSRKICSSLLGKMPLSRRPAETGKPSFDPAEEALQLQPGELVEVKSHAEIVKTLDPNGRHRGLLFMADMVQYCGRRMRVYKPVHRLLMEDSGEVRRMRNTVLLEGSICDGLSVGCDRSCFHFWREIWLRRVNNDISSNAGPDGGLR
ncbi:MAG: hypothetical protein LC126_05570 [Bryobacterales bacterium]|nr:hypothetical protein [Bryobacterales bacterium]